ncbi:Satratoxin biosynthesis SC1 cluster protein 4 [Colletotrichum orbiculare MAFF 240422]|uniref:Satratoxin biosynthesis SC1 cluster protein 4 n=1 Tax=Colletotrichum orbiculare (strain 104-T / ATCC 96160 / CBS 514.97 / LARS 414 / MAFF 240422) TaxID=1213857 RepID=A0A484FGA3_COLOR|nr:Satratoxin biosynthesis SC1 cluster protein 4 [Colletotrichum orbiculare MAFF 240422]
MGVESALSTFVTAIVFTAFSGVLVALRLYTRVFVVRNVGVDDYLIPAALVSSIGLCISLVNQVNYGLGTSSDAISDERLMKFLQYLWSTILTYNLALFFCKLSIIMSYLRVFQIPTTQKICKGMLVVLAIYGAWTIFGSIFQCIPVQAFWGAGQGKCLNQQVFWFSNAGLNIATDIATCAIPIPLIKSLQISRKQKIALMMVFAVGGFVCITSIIRLSSLYEVTTSTDLLKSGVHVATWSGIEANIAIACASVPALKPLVTKLFPKLLSSTHRSNGPSGQAYNAMKGGESHQMKAMQSRRRGTQVDQKIAIETKIEIVSRNGSETDLVRPGGSATVAECYSSDERPPAQGRDMV